MNSPVIPRGDLIALIGTTTRIFDECLLPNGALIEAPVHIHSYPRHARDAHLCRPGVDLTLAILAMDTLGRERRESLTRWLVNRAEGFAETGRLFRHYLPHGPRLGDETDLAGTAALLAVLVQKPSTPAVADVAQLLHTGLAGAAPSVDPITTICELMQAEMSPDRPDVAAAFLEVAQMVRAGDQSAAASAFIGTMTTADSDGHFPEWIGDGVSPRPMLRAHLAFLIAADALGEVASLPKSGYTGRRR